MFIWQPINRWDHQPCKGLLGCCHFLGRQGSHKMRISLLGCETGKRKTLLSELRRRTEWELRKGMRSRMASEEQEWRLHGCPLKAFSWWLESPAEPTTEKDFTPPERYSEFLSQCQKIGCQLLFETPGLLNLIKREFTLKRILISLVPHWNTLYIYFHF